MFSNDLCRSVKFAYNQTITQNGKVELLILCYGKKLLFTLLFVFDSVSDWKTKYCEALFALLLFIKNQNMFLDLQPCFLLQFYLLTWVYLCWKSSAVLVGP